MGAGRTHGERRIGHPPRDHQRRPGPQGIRDRPRAEVGIGDDQLSGHLGDRPPGLHVVEVDSRPVHPLGDPRQNVVTRHHTDHALPLPRPFRQARASAGAGHRVQAPGIGHDRQRARSVQNRQEPLDQVGEVGDIPRGRVFRPQVAQDRECQLGEVFERQDVEVPIGASR